MGFTLLWLYMSYFPFGMEFMWMFWCLAGTFYLLPMVDSWGFMWVMLETFSVVSLTLILPLNRQVGWGVGIYLLVISIGAGLFFMIGVAVAFLWVGLAIGVKLGFWPFHSPIIMLVSLAGWMQIGLITSFLEVPFFQTILTVEGPWMITFWGTSLLAGAVVSQLSRANGLLIMSSLSFLTFMMSSKLGMEMGIAFLLYGTLSCGLCILLNNRTLVLNIMQSKSAPMGVLIAMLVGFPMGVVFWIKIHLLNSWATYYWIMSSFPLLWMTLMMLVIGAQWMCSSMLGKSFIKMSTNVNMWWVIMTMGPLLMLDGCLMLL
uniref:NADH dehydrogenase subunit 2 n=1 Tax=Petrobiona massiliana TaxID=68578 RepID=A0A140CUT2_9METZ|nr:NADH dehydrogenase subunit 2 [Petrobiona massiliana]